MNSPNARAGLTRIWATVRPANTASLHVLHHLGMTAQSVRVPPNPSPGRSGGRSALSIVDG